MESPVQLTSIDVIASALEPVVPTLERLSSPDGAVTLMLSDIADAAAAAERLGRERWERLLADHHLLVEQTVRHHDGQVVRFEQDGFFASFNSAHAGLHAAVDLQRTFAGSPLGEGDGLAIRIGLHSGFVIGNREQLMGRNVVLASRIAAKAGPGEILVSSMLKQYTETDPRFSFDERGEYHFKGMLGEHVVYRARWR
ncbi:MAG: adenylate/guanylate cyclase domain-containing protein [Solirubrobacterales bacterium]|nr:adenylate/guanylate cyclase domain-containing protein [Solirubrobacterales bacterium]MBV9717345.1 adenylate/guanylate cyclase domain-containing protein [Solirubrobacterales bacterium]